MKITAKKLAQHCAKTAGEKKGEDISIMDIRHLSNIADYFVFITGINEKHVKAIAEEIDMLNQKDLGKKVYRIEGMRDAKWVVIDYVDVIVHVCTADARRFYDLERLWNGARQV